MNLEELIYERMSTDATLASKVTKYAGEPAVFYQNAPDDKQNGWHGPQYPRVVYTVDMQADAERKSAGIMQVDLFCDETVTAPEEIVPCIRQCLENLILHPDGTSHYAFAWASTEMFVIEQGSSALGSSVGIAGATIRFDILEYSQQITSNPDPAKAMQLWLKELEPLCVTLGEDRVNDMYEPTGERPAFYVRIQSYQTNRQTYALIWIDCTIVVHVIAPNADSRTAWVRYLHDMLLRTSEATMEDESPLLFNSVQVNNAADYLKQGQITVNATYALSYFADVSHPMNTSTLQQEEGEQADG